MFKRDLPKKPGKDLTCDFEKIEQLERIQRVLTALRLAMGFCVLTAGSFSFFSATEGIQGRAELSAREDPAKEESSATVVPLTGQDQDSLIFEQRNPFHLATKGAGKDSVVLELKSKYRVVGIILDQNPVAVIEDVKNRKTLFLSREDSLEGLVVGDITHGRVLFVGENEELELTF